ncbi:DUF5683 domain-containing protein [Algoriphagus boritolerans]|uniref:DUF5683 domain-containing protein n=1 Tax=Algoriphagus boritolerans DSM 17298 = JCM 18970 TaxID=1120964 RepID=A0A1H5WDQ3_9BACT|nr:DUF5683 domain-containing protein [Algoriphagus boritolerans]SEF97592.1 hypothetical protein SAMN03080598_02052 [Algoriphagus boritolerans DSM 17298 = JCM 18970]
MSRIHFHSKIKNKTPWISLGILLLLFLWSGPSFSQNQEETEEVETPEVERPDLSSLPKNPRKATLLSAILPGAGQVYNNKAWKVPILYAGFMADIYFINFNNKRYQTFRTALFAFDDGDRSQFPSLNREALVRNVDYWRQNRDMTILLLAAIYALNLIDANVDAHLSGFDISDDISMKIEPNVGTFAASGNTMGLSLKFQLK